MHMLHFKLLILQYIIVYMLISLYTMINVISKVNIYYTCTTLVERQFYVLQHLKISGQKSVYFTVVYISILCSLILLVHKIPAQINDMEEESEIQ